MVYTSAVSTAGPWGRMTARYGGHTKRRVTSVHRPYRSCSYFPCRRCALAACDLALLAALLASNSSIKEWAQSSWFTAGLSSSSAEGRPSLCSLERGGGPVSVLIGVTAIFPITVMKRSAPTIKTNRSTKSTKLAISIDEAGRALTKRWWWRLWGWRWRG